jgi:predicted amidohydrolase
LFPVKTFKAALAQIPIEDGNVERNMASARQAVLEAAAQHVDILNLPEAADWGWLYQNARQDAFTIPGKYTNFLAGLSRKHRIWITAGCLEKDGDRVYNAAVIIDRSGNLVLKHRKISTLAPLTRHLYDQGRAQDIRAFDTEFGRVGLTICADNFNIANPRRLAKQGAWFVVAPHGFAEKPEKMDQNAVKFQRHVSSVAARTGLWVIAVNSVLGTVQGGAWRGREHCGCSMIARPDGSAAVMAKYKEPDLVVCDIPVAA